MEFSSLLLINLWHRRKPSALAFELIFDNSIVVITKIGCKDMAAIAFGDKIALIAVSRIDGTLMASRPAW